MINEFNPEGKDIRFIDSHYKDLFHIPDGGTIQVHYSDDSVVIKPCMFIDEYHTQIGNNVFHICQFAELLERKRWLLSGRNRKSWGMKLYGRLGVIGIWYFRPVRMVTTIPCLTGTFGKLMAVSWIIRNFPCWKQGLRFWRTSGFQMRELRAEVYEEIMEKVEAAEKLSVIAQLKQISGQPAPSQKCRTVAKNRKDKGDVYVAG